MSSPQGSGLPRILRRSLSNGIRCVFVEDSRISTQKPRILATLLVGSGAASDPVGRKGLAHVLEHVAFRPGDEIIPFFPRPLADAFRARKVVYFPARTELDFTRFSLSAPKELFSEVFSFFRTWMSSIRCEPDLVEQSVAEVIAEKESQRKESAVARVYDGLYRSSFGTHPYGAYTVGKFPNLRKITAKDCGQYLVEHYRPSNFVLLCLFTGPPDGIRDEQVADMAEKLLQDAPGALERPVRLEFPDALPRGRNLTLRGDSRALGAGFRAPPLRQSKPGLMELVHQLFLGPKSRVRELLGKELAGLGGFLPSTRYSGLYEVILIAKEQGNKETLSRAISVLLDSAAILARNPVSRVALESARVYAVEHWDAQGGSPPLLSEQLAAHELLGLGVEQWYNRKTEMAESDSEAVCLESQRLLDPEGFATARVDWMTGGRNT